MKRALVLSGGGSRGAYECGAWEALCEMGIRIDAVYGTSIGAINAALVAQGNLQRAIEIWETIDMNRIAARDDGEEINIGHMLTRKRDLIPFLVENAKNLQLDISPMEKLLNEKIDEGKVRASGTDLGVMLTSVNHFSGYPVRLKDIPQGQLVDHLLASAACFPVFPIRKIAGQRYIDGGFVDNMPIGMAIEDGADEIIAVDIHPKPVHPEYGNMPFLRLIHPLRDLGNFLDFNHEILNRSRRMGYYDTMKSYGTLDGIRYTYRRVNELDVTNESRRYLNSVALFDARVNDKNEDTSLMAMLTAETPQTQLTWKDSLLRGLELCAEVMEFREDSIYSMRDQTTLVLDYVRGYESDVSSLKEAAKISGRALMAYIYRCAKANPEYIKTNAKKLSEYPMETAAALYLLSMQS